MTLKFTKMHGLGNDFMVIDGINQPVNLLPSQIANLAARHTGIGFDQCLLVEKSNQDNIDFFYRIFNADGQEVGQCGNGARCLARFIDHYGLSTKKKFRVATSSTEMELTINADDQVTVNMGQPHLQPELIPLQTTQQAINYQLPLNNSLIHTVHALNVGNPHAVTVVADITLAPVTTLGKEISEHSFFPQQVNAGFMEIVKANHLKLRVYERGCGETQACGSGAVAAAVVGRLFYELEERITVDLPGGQLVVEWPDFHSPILLTGPASFVYEGKLF